MRLGGIALAPQSVDEITRFAETADVYGISAIVAPAAIATMSEDEAHQYGETARAAGLVIGETGFWENLITIDTDLRRDRLRRLRSVLRNADAMGCRSVAILTGTRHSSDKAFAAHPYMFTPQCRHEVRDVVLRALDGFEGMTRLGIEPYAHSFFYGPESAHDFLRSVDHPALGIHLDQANMISHADFFATTELIERSFDLLAEFVVSVHLKDMDWPASHLGLAWREVDLGSGVMDFSALLKRVDQLDSDMTCFCEHWPSEADYARNFQLAHVLAAKAGTRFIGRNSVPVSSP